MPYEKDYVRNLAANEYDIDNPVRLDGESLPIRLAKEIEILFPEDNFCVRCDDGGAKVIFMDRDISSSEKAPLDTLLQDHKENR